MHRSHSILLFCLFVACSAGKSDSQQIADLREAAQQTAFSEAYVPGVVYPAINVNNDPLRNFALYLPKNYTPQIAWPLICFFDPQGHGELPINKYKHLADSVGCIMVGSNFFKNGQNSLQIIEDWKLLKHYLTSTFHIQHEQLVIAGFSGGARAACQIAVNDSFVSAVIANSAALPGLAQYATNMDVFIGITGKGDMNRAEMISNHQQMKNSGRQSYFISFDGIHAWCPNTCMQQAISLIKINWLSKQANPNTADFLIRYQHDTRRRIDSLKNRDQWLDAYSEAENLSTCSANFPDMLNEISQQPAYEKLRQEAMKINAMETAIQQDMIKKMNGKIDTTQWSRWMADFTKLSANKDAGGFLYQRLLGYASLLCYSYSHRMIAANRYKEAATLVHCYQQADRLNPEVYYLLAVIDAAESNYQGCLNHLKQSQSMGFNDTERIFQQKEFAEFRKKPEFSLIMKR